MVPSSKTSSTRHYLFCSHVGTHWQIDEWREEGIIVSNNIIGTRGGVYNSNWNWNSSKCNNTNNNNFGGQWSRTRGRSRRGGGGSLCVWFWGGRSIWAVNGTGGWFVCTAPPLAGLKSDPWQEPKKNFLSANTSTHSKEGAATGHVCCNILDYMITIVKNIYI